MIVVLGAFGRTGRVTAAHLESAGQVVRRITRSAERLSSAQPGVVRARLSDEAELATALQGARAVLALLPDDLQAESFHAERRAMAEAMTRAIVRERVPRVVLISSATASLGEQRGAGFGADLAYFERLLLNTSATVSVLRASYFQDNLTELLPGAARDGVYPNLFGSRDTPIATVATLDVGAFAARTLLEPVPRDSEIIDLTGPEYSVTEFAGALSEVLGRSLSIADVPKAEQEAMFGSWMSAEAAKAMVETLSCLGSGRARAGSERVLRGATNLDRVLRAALAHSAHERPAARP